MRNPFGTPVSVRILLFGGVGSAAALSIASRMSLACAGCIRARTFPASTILNCRIAFWPPRGRDWRHVSHTWPSSLIPDDKWEHEDDPIRQPWHAPFDTRRRTYRRRWPRDQFELREAVREKRHACRRSGKEPGKPVLEDLEKTHGVRRYACDASEPAFVESLFQNVVRDLGAPTLVVHNIDGRVPGIFARALPKPTQPWCSRHFGTQRSARFLVGQQAARLMRENKMNANGTKGTIVFTNASAALTGFPSRGAFAMAYHAKSGSHRAWQGN